MIGKLQRVALRDVWKHEAADFTTWLQDNLDVLNEVTGLSLSSAEREQAAGAFNIDLVAEDGSGNPVVIENQLEKSDHDHLGKLITYVTATDAHAAVWIVSEPRPEHASAITRLNQSGLAQFYMLKLEAIRINDSHPAPLLTLIAQPSEEGLTLGKVQKEFAERHMLRWRFWEGLLEVVKHKTKLHANVGPSKENWISTGAGKSGLSYNYTVRQHDTGTELYIDRGKETGNENQAIFQQLFAAREEIEHVFGGPLDWQLLEGKRACRIEKRLSLGGYHDEEKWPEIFEATIKTMINLEKAFKPHIEKLQI